MFRCPCSVARVQPLERVLGQELSATILSELPPRQNPPFWYTVAAQVVHAYLALSQNVLKRL